FGVGSRVGAGGGFADSDGGASPPALSEPVAGGLPAQMTASTRMTPAKAARAVAARLDTRTFGGAFQSIGCQVFGGGATVGVSGDCETSAPGATSAAKAAAGSASISVGASCAPVASTG